MFLSAIRLPASSVFTEHVPENLLRAILNSPPRGLICAVRAVTLCRDGNHRPSARIPAKVNLPCRS